jgi:hypothetical protein
VQRLGGTGARYDGRASGGSGPPPAGRPPNPGNNKNCGDFPSWVAANAWFQTYYPYCGDVAQLDADNDGIPCESLPGHP